MYVIVRDDGKFVSKPGSENSYTSLLMEARVFASSEDAKRDGVCVENERIVSVYDLLSPNIVAPRR
jgi:hypothetical protein